ncbi:tRNA methyltransferase, has a role in tRNA modification [Elasticomyces elasticus]|nr:hypothetical protein LTR28_010096 [Elasticomyces elasticus]KAK4996433.1 tRNA methyltransferase, has a role in tRNA modification [Elasticomyces elasticus]
MADMANSGEEYEEEHVHAVYEQIASHFSSTRYKPWPIVEHFLQCQRNGAIGLDIGCGNGKYLAVNPNVFIVASDRSSNLTTIASKHQPHYALVADGLALPHPRAVFDFAISIAVVHHLSTPARRIEAVRSILETLHQSSSTGEAGSALIYVWALEQKDSRRGWDEGHEQDVMVPWVMKGKTKETTKAKAISKCSNRGVQHEHRGTQQNQDSEKPTAPIGDRTFHRYYHLYRKGELEHDIEEAGGRVLEAGYEKDNWWAIAEPKS